MEIGPDDLEIFSSLEPDVPTNGFRQFGSYFGELVLVTEFTCADDVDRSLIADRIHEVSNSLQEGVIFEMRQVDIAHSNTITSLILYPEGGFLSQLLFSDINIGWYFRLKIALDIARALGSLHEINYVHNDLRSSVLGLDCEWHCRFLELPRLQKLGDIFVPEKPAPGISGDKRYFAPEVILHSFCSSASDMYSFGLLLFEICARVAAFSITRDEETQVVDVEELLDCLPSSTPESLQQLIRQLLGPEAEYRPTVEDTIDWLDSLIMETSTADDPGEPPLPPLPFSQVRKSSKHTKGSKAIGITPKDAERLREIAQKTRESQARIADAIRVDSEITSESLAQHDSFSPVPNDRRFFFPQQGPEENDEDDQNEDEVRASIANQKAHDTIVAALGRNAVIGQRDFHDAASDLRCYLQLKAHNLPIHKNKFFFFKEANLVWCSDKKLVDRVERLHNFDLTVATMEETGPLSIVIKRIEDVDPFSPTNAKPSKSYLFGSSKERDQLLIKFPSLDVANQWKPRLKQEMSSARCQMCLCKVILSPDQIFQRDKHRYQSQENTPGLQFPELAFFCSEQCARFRSAVQNKGLNVGTTTKGSLQLKITDADLQTIDKRLVSKRNPAAWKRLSMKNGLVASPSSPDMMRYGDYIPLPKSVGEWLESINEVRLIGLFQEKGYDSIEQIMIAGLAEEDMKYLGITAQETIQSLIKSSNKLSHDFIQFRRQVILVEPLLSSSP